MTIVKPGAGATPWQTTGDALVDAVNAMQDYFCDVSMSAGVGTTIQTLTNATFTLLNLDTVTTDTGSNFNTVSHLYTVPAAGRYFCQANVRTRDSTWTTTGGANLGTGIHTSNVDFAGFQWNKIMPLNVGSGRCTVDYTRIAVFNQGDQLRLYAFQDSGASQDLYSAAMQIWRIA